MSNVNANRTTIVLYAQLYYIFNFCCYQVIEAAKMDLIGNWYC